jgi:hypothetical protein
MTTQKSLGQIAYEADPLNDAMADPWAEASPGTRAAYEQIAQAVAREVLRRQRAKKEKNL